MVRKFWSVMNRDIEKQLVNIKTRMHRKTEASDGH